MVNAAATAFNNGTATAEQEKLLEDAGREFFRIPEAEVTLSKVGGFVVAYKLVLGGELVFDRETIDFEQDDDDVMFSTDTEFLLKQLTCDGCKKGFTLHQVLFTDGEEDFCEKCVNPDRDLRCVTAKERCERHALDQIGEVRALLGLNF